MKTIVSVFHPSPKAHICLLAFLSLLLTRSVFATDNYAYRADEYAEISGGKSPDGQWSIAAHGDDSTGYEGFQLYLMREPAHKQVAPLPTDEHLDTAPLSNVALWSADARHVAILYRTDRHVLDVRLFNVAAGKVRPIMVPSLVGTASHGRLTPDGPEELLGRYYRFEWQDAKRFILGEFDGFRSTEPISRTGIEVYLHVDEGDNNSAFFSASVVCNLTAGDKLSLSKITPLPVQKDTIVYSPHLRFDPERGLYDTETTMSSLEMQKEHK